MTIKTRRRLIRLRNNSGPFVALLFFVFALTPFSTGN